MTSLPFIFFRDVTTLIFFRDVPTLIFFHDVTTQIFFRDVTTLIFFRDVTGTPDAPRAKAAFSLQDYTAVSAPELKLPFG